MSNLIGMLGTLSIAVLLLTGANYYLISRRTTLLGGYRTHKLPLLLISLCIGILVVVLIMTQFSDTKFFSITGSIGSRLFMLIPLLAVLTGIEHLRSTIISSFPHITQRGEITQKCPRMRRGITLGIFLAIFAYGVYAALVTKITETTITTDKISHDLKILLVADFHVDDILSTIHLKALKKQIELQQPDIILIAGDFFNKANARLATYYEVLSGINIPMYAIEGNHDMMGNEEKGLALRQIEALTNIHFLYNESIVFPERNLQLIGIEEKGQWRNTNPNEIKALEETIQSTHLQYNDTFNILMTHQPIHLAKTRSLPINLEVAGHTHKLQIRGLHFLSYLLNDYTYGLYERQDRKAFVTQGIGTRGLPVRLGTRSEIVLIHLTTT